MIEKINGYFVITTNNPKALELTSRWMYYTIRREFLIEIEEFSDTMLYRILIPANSGFDAQEFEDYYLKGSNVTLMI